MQDNKPHLDDDIIEIYQQKYENDIEHIGNDTSSFLNFVLYLADKFGLPQHQKDAIVAITNNLIVREWEEWKEALKRAWETVSPFRPNH